MRKRNVAYIRQAIGLIVASAAFVWLLISAARYDSDIITGAGYTVHSLAALAVMFGGVVAMQDYDRS